MKLDRHQLDLHLPWAILALACMLGGLGWYLAASWQAARWLGGGSPAGLTCGLLAGGIILFEMLLWPRKAMRRLRLGATKHWMAAHVWLGLACLPLAVGHCGFHWGGALPSFLMSLLVVAVLSGIFGLVMQNLLPSWMLRNLPAETIHSQIEHVSQQAIDDLRRMLTTACGPPRLVNRGTATDSMDLMPDLSEPAAAVVVGAVRELGRVRGRTLRTTAIATDPTDAQILWNAFEEMEAYLQQGGNGAATFRDALRSEKYFATLRRTCHDSSAPLIDAMAQSCDQRRQFDRQHRAVWWLQGWLPFHLGVSIAVTILLLAHIWTALKYW